jgi:SARP family transcriptional regulator, regulator of embCAB operon
MRALAASGNVAEALAVYERLRILLRDELGVDPSDAVQDAYVQLLR